MFGVFFLRGRITKACYPFLSQPRLLVVLIVALLIAIMNKVNFLLNSSRLVAIEMSTATENPYRLGSANGNTYTGEYQNGKPDGKGLYKWRNGEIYDGQFTNGLKSGNGLWKGI